MWTRTPEKKNDELEFYKKTKEDDDRIKLNLEDERVLTEAWASLCFNRGTVTDQGMVDLEEMIKKSAILCWGPCSFKIDRETKIFIVSSTLDNRTMDLVSGSLD